MAIIHRTMDEKVDDAFASASSNTVSIPYEGISFQEVNELVENDDDDKFNGLAGRKVYEPVLKSMDEIRDIIKELPFETHEEFTQFMTEEKIDVNEKYTSDERAMSPAFFDELLDRIKEKSDPQEHHETARTMLSYSPDGELSINGVKTTKEELQKYAENLRDKISCQVNSPGVVADSDGVTRFEQDVEDKSKYEDWGDFKHVVSQAETNGSEYLHFDGKWYFASDDDDLEFAQKESRSERVYTFNLSSEFHDALFSGVINGGFKIVHLAYLDKKEEKVEDHSPDKFYDTGDKVIMDGKLMVLGESCWELVDKKSLEPKVEGYGDFERFENMMSWAKDSPIIYFSNEYDNEMWHVSTNQMYVLENCNIKEGGMYFSEYIIKDISERGVFERVRGKGSNCVMIDRLAGVYRIYY